MLAVCQFEAQEATIQPVDPWHVLRVFTGREDALKGLLDDANVESTVIKHKVKRLPHGASRPTMVDRPIFPGYVLIRCVYEEGGSVLREFPFVIEFLRFGLKFAQVQQEELDRVNRLIESGLHIVARSHLTRGQKVRVKYGPLLGVIGEFVKEKNGDTFVINVEMMGRSLATRMSWDQVEPVVLKNPTPQA